MILAISDLLIEERQEIKRLAEEDREQARSHDERLQRERFVISEIERQKRSKSAPSSANGRAVDQPISSQPRQPQKQKERIRVHEKDDLEELLQAGELKGSELRIMARKLKVLNAVIERLSARTMLPVEVVEPRFAEFARAQGLTQAQFLGQLSKVDNENGKALQNQKVRVNGRRKEQPPFL